MIEDKKICSDCNVLTPRSEFYPNRAKCKLCISAGRKVYYQNNKEMLRSKTKYTYRLHKIEQNQQY